MKPDRQPRGQRLPTVPETTSLLGKPGTDATSPRAFAARSPPQPRRLLPYVAACMGLGLLALYFLGVSGWHAARWGNTPVIALRLWQFDVQPYKRCHRQLGGFGITSLVCCMQALPIGNSSGAWIRSLPQKRHNPAAKTPQLPQPTDAQPDAAASQLEDGASQSGKQLSGDAGSGSVKLDSSDPGSMDGSGRGSLASSSGDVSSDPALDDADSDAQQAVKADDTAAQNAGLQASIPAPAPAPNARPAAAKEESSDKKSQAAAESPAEQDHDAARSGGSAPAPQADQLKQASDSKDSASEAPESGDSRDSDTEGRGSAAVDSSDENSLGAPSSNAENPVASENGTGEEGAALEQTAPSNSSAEAAPSSAAKPADSSERPAAVDRSTDSSQGAVKGSLSRASAPDEAALLADPIAKVPS